MSKHSKSQSAADLLWSAALRKKEFSSHDLAYDTGLSASTISKNIRLWLESQLVEKLGPGAKNRTRYRVINYDDVKPLAVADNPPHAREESLHGNMWIVMRRQGSFTPSHIAMLATSDLVEVTQKDAAEYCRSLLRAKYLRVERKAKPGKVEPAYRLINDTGPVPPRERRVRAMFDGNLSAFVHYEGTL